MPAKNTVKKFDESFLKDLYRFMLKSRVLEERLIKIYRAGDSFFWIGAPGEEAWGVPLGLLAHKGQGPEFDYLHLHYRATPTLIAMGMEMIDSIRLSMNRVTDPSTGGRNFCNHYCFPQWNVVPVSSPIEVQYLMGLGTARAQKRRFLSSQNKKSKKPGVTIVTGGDAGTAEGDFASCLVWASRPADPLPMLITVQNNGWGISTNYSGQHGETTIADRAKGFNIRARVINGNDPLESYLAVQEELEYIRSEQKPSFIEARVSRLYGHSSASGANLVTDEECPLAQFEKKLIKEGVLTEKVAKELRQQFEDEGLAAQNQVKSELGPQAESIWDHIYVNSEQADWRAF